MTTSDLLDMVKTAPAEELPALKLDIAAAAAIIEARQRDIAATAPPPEPTGDMTADEVVIELGLKKRAQVYTLASRGYDPLPSYNVNKRVKRFPRVAVADWKRRQSERRD